MDESEKKLFDIFFPYASERLGQAKANFENFRFSYYTSASTGIKILKKSQVWLRNAALMNDFSEVHHGQSCLQEAWDNSRSAGQLKALLTLMHPSAVDDFVRDFNFDQPSRTKNSFLLCISEHGGVSQDEDLYGRLSMWRAYGGKTNVAFVFKPKIFLGDSDAFGIYTSPVLYADKPLFAERFEAFVEGLLRNREFLLSIHWNVIKSYLHLAMRASVLSTKHPGFSEEKEWRLIYSPDTDQKRRVSAEIVDIEGIPQTIYKVPLKDFPEDGLVGATIPDLLDRIIVGPTEHPFEVKQAFVEQLKSINVPDADERVIVSGIPLKRS